jgi:hypothetical protein
LSLSVGVSGGPVAYRWFKDGTFISNATNATYSVPFVTANNAGSYRVVVSNIVNVLTSAVATVTIASDTEGPHMLAAIIANVTGAGTFATNTINVLWDESLTSASAQNTNNYKLVMSTNSNIRIPVTRAIYSSALGTLLTVDSTNAYWSATGEYYLIVNNVADNHGNNINPNSVIGVSLLLTSNLVQMSDQWSFYDCDDVNFCDPDSDAVYANEAWTKTNYVVTPVWGSGFGIFVKAPGNPTNVCAGDHINTSISWQPDPTLFRKTFVLPPGASPNAKVKLRFTYDDGLIIYLNGRSIYTNNVTPGPITKASRAPTETTGELCNTNTPFLDINNLLPGTNWLAAAVVQVAPGGGIDPGLDTVFGLEMDMLTARTARAPTNFPPGTPTITRSVVRSPQTNFVVLSWPETNYGYALMYSTDITDYGYAYRNGAPISGNPGPNPARRWYTNAPLWLQVSNQANPFTNPIPTGTTGPRRFYKLFREKLND